MPKAELSKHTKASRTSSTTERYSRNDAILQNTTAFSVGGWAKGSGTLFIQETTDTGTFNQANIILVQPWQDGNVYWGDRQALLSHPHAVDDEWHHYLVVMDSNANTLTLYIDGQQVAQDTSARTALPVIGPANPSSGGMNTDFANWDVFGTNSWQFFGAFFQNTVAANGNQTYLVSDVAISSGTINYTTNVDDEDNYYTGFAFVADDDTAVLIRHHGTNFPAFTVDVVNAPDLTTDVSTLTSVRALNGVVNAASPVFQEDPATRINDWVITYSNDQITYSVTDETPFTPVTANNTITAAEMGFPGGFGNRRFAILNRNNSLGNWNQWSVNTTGATTSTEISCWGGDPINSVAQTLDFKQCNAWSRALSTNEVKCLWNEGAALTWDRAKYLTYSSNEGWWPFDDLADNGDISEQVRHLNVIGEVDRGIADGASNLYSEEETRNAFASETNSYLALTTANGPSTSQAELTVSLWTKLSNTGTIQDLYYERRTDTDQAMILIRSFVDGTIGAQVWDTGTAGATIISPVLNLWDGEWHHITMVADGANLTLYVDGVQQAQRTWSGTVLAQTSYMSIGASTLAGNTPSNIISSSTSISNVSIWTNALTSAERDNLYYRGCGVARESFSALAIPTPTHHYPLDLKTVFDDTDGGAHLAAFNTPTWEQGPALLAYPNKKLSVGSFYPAAGTSVAFGTDGDLDSVVNITNMTVMLWARCDTLPDVGAVAATIEGSTGGFTRQADLIGIQLNSTRTVHFVTSYGVAVYPTLTSAQTWELGDWVFCAGRIVNGVKELFVDGVWISEGINRGAPNAPAPRRLHIGKHLGGLGWQGNDVAVRDIAFYDRALSDAEITNAYECAIFPDNGLQAHYKDGVTDISPNDRQVTASANRSDIYQVHDICCGD